MFQKMPGRIFKRNFSIGPHGATIGKTPPRVPLDFFRRWEPPSERNFVALRKGRATHIPLKEESWLLRNNTLQGSALCSRGLS